MTTNLLLLNVCAFSGRKRKLFLYHTHLADEPLSRSHFSGHQIKLLCGVSKHDPQDILVFVLEKQTYSCYSGSMIDSDRLEFLECSFAMRS